MADLPNKKRDGLGRKKMTADCSNYARQADLQFQSLLLSNGRQKPLIEDYPI